MPLVHNYTERACTLLAIYVHGVLCAGVVCPESLPTNTGNKIVPIAVGAALAGLVIVVLVAYLIGRLRNRKKSSYEALS